MTESNTMQNTQNSFKVWGSKLKSVITSNIKGGVSRLYRYVLANIKVAFRCLKREVLELLNASQKVKFQGAILAVLLITFLGWSKLSSWGIPNVFHIGQAFAWVLVGVYFYRDSKNFFSGVFVALSVSNLLDELFFDPTTFSVNEGIFVIISLILLYKYGHKQQQ